LLFFYVSGGVAVGHIAYDVEIHVAWRTCKLFLERLVARKMDGG